MFLIVEDMYINTDLIKHFSIHINTDDETLEVKFYNGYPNILGSQIFKKKNFYLDVHRDKLSTAIINFLCPWKEYAINDIRSLNSINEESVEEFENIF